MPHSYPQILLPKPQYRYIDNNDVLNSFLVRYVDRVDETTPITDIDDEVLADFIYWPSERIEDLSLSLLGHYQLEDVQICFTESSKVYYSQSWSPGDAVTSPSFPGDFYFDKKRAYWYIPFNSLHERHVTVTLGEGRTLQKLPAISSVNHKPTSGNFWHYTLNWNVDGFDLSDETKYNKGERKRIAKKIGANQRAFVIDAALTNFITVDGLPTHCYLNN